MQFSVSWRLVLIIKEKAVSGMMAAAGRRDTESEETIRQKSISEIAVQTIETRGSRLLQLPVSGANS